MRLVFKLVMQIADWPAKCVCESLYWCSMGHHWNVSSGPCGAVTDIYCPLLMMPFKYVAGQKRLKKTALFYLTHLLFHCKLIMALKKLIA